METRSVAAGLAVIGIIVAGGKVSAAGGAMPTCTVAGIELVASPAAAEPAIQLLATGGFSGCFGAYGFLGVTPRQLGYPGRTTDNYTELAVLLRHWNSIDGVPAVTEWVDLSPAVAEGMRAAGIRPMKFLQWVNEYDGAGTVDHPVVPPTWPPWLPRALVSDPATISGGAADRVISGPQSIPPPDAAPQHPVIATAAPALPTLAGQPESATTLRAPGTGLRVGRATPPVVATVGRVTVPCVVTLACRRAVSAHDRWVAVPWFVKVGLDLWWDRWWAMAALALVVAAVLRARAAFVGHRNLAWYGDIRGPK